MVALALKLSPYFLIEDKDKRPIIVLDDVMSELDKNHQTRLIEFLKKFDQVFITATKLYAAEPAPFSPITPPRADCFSQLIGVQSTSVSK